MEKNRSKSLHQSQLFRVMGRNSTGDTTVSGLDALQGTWVGHALGQGDEVTLVTLTFSGNSFHLTYPDAEVKGTFVLNEEPVPNQADLAVKESFWAHAVGKTAKCIYELKNDSLMLSSFGPGVEIRRSDFEPSGNGFLFQLKRQPSNQE